MGLGDVLKVVAGLTGEPDPDLIADLTTTSPYEVGDRAFEQIGQIDDRQTLSAIHYGLEHAAQAADIKSRGIYNAERIASLLPEIEKIIVAWEDDTQAPRSDTDTWSPIHQLQSALGQTADGVFGRGSAEALLKYQTDSYNNDFEYGSPIDLNDYPDTYLYARVQDPEQSQLLNAAHTAYDDRETAAHALSSRNDGINSFIAAEFESCSDDVTGFGDIDAFQSILDKIGPLAQIAEEETIAHETIANAIQASCGRFLEQVDPTIQEELINTVAAKIEPVLRERIGEAVHQANEAAIRRLYEQGQKNPVTNNGPFRDASL